MDALRTRQDEIRFIQVHHEESAGFHGMRLRNSQAGEESAWQLQAREGFT